MEHGLENEGNGYSIRDRTNAVAKHLLGNPDNTNEDGENITDSVVTALVNTAITRCHTAEVLDEDERTVRHLFEIEEFRREYPALERALARDGFTVEGGELRRTLPEGLDLPKADDEVHLRLSQHGFAVSRTHLDQGIAAHARGEWAGANGQFRTFIESLFDEMAAHLAGNGVPVAGVQRRQWLAHAQPPFFDADLNEWSDDGRGFMESFFRRLHPDGAHPGVSDEEDCTFRLHLVLLVARNLLRRLSQR